MTYRISHLTNPKGLPVRFLLITSIRDEGTSIWEWVAHHKKIGFTDIVVFQNDSTDGSIATLKLLHKMGVIKYLNNPDEDRGWQMKAYRRIKRMPIYQEVDYAMALDGDEYLHIKTPEGTVQSLVAAVPDVDEIRINWKIFGSGGFLTQENALVTSRFTMAEDPEHIVDQIVGQKTLFKARSFALPHIHRPRQPLKENLTETNGSGLSCDAYTTVGWRSNDPAKRVHAQINHYVLRDAESFMLKAVKGRPGYPNLDVSRHYWSKFDINHTEDRALSDRSDDLLDYMMEMDAKVDGRLSFLRMRSLKWQKAMFDASQEEEEYRDLYAFTCGKDG